MVHSLRCFVSAALAFAANLLSVQHALACAQGAMFPPGPTTDYRVILVRSLAGGVMALVGWRMFRRKPSFTATRMAFAGVALGVLVLTFVF